jgi:uncharacterized protein YjiS (DUF1127 family)
VPEPYDFAFPRVDYLSMPFEQQQIFKQALVRYAHAERGRRIRAALLSVVTLPWHTARGLTARFGAALIRWWRAQAERRARLRGAAELGALSDRELWDIGLRRCEIDSAVRHGRETERRTPVKDRANSLATLTSARSGGRSGATERKRAA